MLNKIAYSSAKFITVDLIGDILYWSIWWYTKGLIKAALFCWQEIKAQEQRLGLSIWLRNIFTPMFGQYDLEGRIISFFIRLFQVIARALILLIWTILVFILFFVWLVLPIIIVYEIIDNFIWLF